MNINQSREASEKGVYSLLIYLLFTVNSLCKTFEIFHESKLGATWLIIYGMQIALS